MTLQTLILEGGNALSEFRIQQLIPSLQALCPEIKGLTGQYLHLVASPDRLDQAHQNVLKQLLAYGEPFETEASIIIVFINTPSDVEL